MADGVDLDFYFRICFTFNNAEFMRAFKFRLFYPEYGQSQKPTMLYSQDYLTHGELLTIGECDLSVLGPGSLKIMQYVGLKDKNGKEIYEGDIFRIEESGSNGEPDEIFYVVITWIREWCMFGSLIAKSEYQDYIDSGVKALDEPLFWTYTLEDTDSRKHFLCGNIYETPNLLK